MNKYVWKYSGHEAGFNEPLIECKKCHTRMRADKMTEMVCEKCGSAELTEPKQFNTMLKTNIGPVEDDESYAYLRPETAQGIYINFKNVVDTTSQKIPFGIAQIGKSFRNEITPKNFIFRVREFEQMEMQFFVKPGEDEKWHKYWVDQRLNWWKEQGLADKNIRLHEQTKDELAHYAKAAFDLEYDFPHGFDELEGLHNRQDFDLGAHSKDNKKLALNANVMENKHSNTKLMYNDPQGENFIPFIIETSCGVDRGAIALITEAYTKEKLEDGKQRIVLKFKPHIAPIKAAVIPLARNNEALVRKAKAIKDELQELGLGRVILENTGNIGKNYRKHDEIGTPICVTVDYETLENEKESVTIRDRDSMKQTRIPINEITSYFKDYYK
jgi:glycyl-tRNA synthetase